ncbi:helicase-related protein [uncultured Duncaniella sp.]|uniref:helicase-related protein n=1 Tax=uncultured Duncaniella sp. TaxID=2768039 RepID=UPI0025956FD8|nr:helicase-related protein [uncultured Duncaniella sp.]
MADKITNLYNALVKSGYNMASEEVFRERMNDPSKRKAAYDAMVKSGYNMRPYEEFEANIGYAPKPQASPTPAPAPQQQSAPAAPVVETPAPAPQAEPEAPKPAQTWKPSEQDKIRMSYQLNTMLNDFNQKSRARIEQTRRMTEHFTPEGRKKLKAKKFQAQLAGTPTQVMGLTPPTSVSASEAQGGEADGAEQKPIQSGQSPVPYGVKYVDGKPVTEWLLPDGRLTTSLIKADQAEYGARTVRLRNQFVGRMKENGLDPAKQEDVQKQAQLDYEAPMRKVLSKVWAQAEAEDREADEEYTRQLKEYNNSVRSNIRAYGPDGMPLPTPEENIRDYNRAVKRKETFNLEKMAESVYAGLPSSYRNSQLHAYQQYFSTHTNELNGRTVQSAAEEALKGEVYQAVYQHAVDSRMPKSKTEFFLRKLADQPFVSTYQAMDMAASAMTGSYGMTIADQAAMSQYGQEHRVLDIIGTIGNMAIDPTTYISGGVGSAAGKQALKIAGKQMIKGATKDMAERFATRTLTGRLVQGAAGGAFNFATYETLKNLQQQASTGGMPDYATGTSNGFSGQDLLNATKHGFIMGGIVGTASPIIGNVADKAVKVTTSTAGKMAVRGGEVAVSTLAEGTIFSIPEWISGERDAMDVWTDNMAMMLGFKAQHGLKSAPRVIAGLRPIKPTEGRPLTQAERTHNRMNFEERLRKNMDASPNDLSFTADEREELRRAGYGELADLFSRDKERPISQPNPAEGAIELRAERAEAETIYNGRPEFDGYSAMEELMQDGRVSEAARAKAYYILTGRMLPMSSVTGYQTTTAEDGSVIVNATNANGDVVTSRKFANKEKAQGEVDNIMRQAELNTIDVGERFAEATADDMVLSAAVNEVSPGADPEAVKRIYRAVKAGNKDVTEEQVQLAEFIDDAIARNKDIADAHRPEAIRNTILEETGIDVDAALRKSPAKRTEAEKEAVKTYLERLFPEEARQRAAQPTSEQAEAQSKYEEGRLLYGRFEEGDPTVQADADAIAIRMQEAYQGVEDAFGAESEYYMFHLNENPWDLLNDPELTVEQQDAVLYYINAKAALDGVMDASNEAADRKRAEVEQAVEKRTHKDSGVIIPATMKVDNRQVYVVKGDVVMFPDGTAVDARNSSEHVVVMDAQSGEYEFTSPDQILNISEAVDPQEELRAAHEVIEQEQMSMFSGGENPADEAAKAEEQPTGNNTEENIPMPNVEEYDRGYSDAIEEAENLTDERLATYVDALREGAQKQMQEQGRVDDYIRGRLEALEFVQQDRAADSVPKTDESVPNTTENAVSEGENVSETDASVGNGQETALSRIPLNEEGEPMFEAVEKETAWDGLVEAVGGESDAADIATAQVQQATSDLEALKKKPPTPKAPKLKGSPMAMAQAKREAAEKYQSELANYNQQIADTQARLDAWNAILGVYTSRSAELRRQREEERRQRDAEAHDAAVAQFEEQQRIKAEKQAEQERVGVHAVNPKIKDKWDNTPKIEGNPDAITLPDGSTIRGRYVLTEAGAASASHDVNNAYEPTEAFPIDENGQSVNDRDYLRDKDAQRIVEQMAGAYDNRALQTPVIVSRDGVVLSGNNRTMSGDLAARQGTDKAYIDYLREFGQKYGFTPEQVAGMKNPRLVFVPDEALPYDATTFSRFNAQEMKSQSKPEAAVKLGKIVPDNIFNDLVGEISRYDRLSDYYADEKAVAHALGALMQAGVINDKQMPEMRTGTALSAAGKELIENTLIGKVFQTSPDAVRQIISMPTMRQSIVMGLNEIAGNRTLSRSGYDLSEELSKAVDLVYRAKSSQPDIYTDGMPVSPFGRMQGLFDDEYGDSRVTDATTLLLADLLNSGKPSDLRKVLTSYNNEASQSASGQADLFTGEIPTKENILTNVNEHFRNATPREQQALVDAAIAERKRRAEAEAEQRGRDQASEQTPNVDERNAERSEPVAEERTDLEPLGKDRNDFNEDTPEEAALRARISVGDEWEETGPDAEHPIYKRKLYVDGKHEIIQTDAPDNKGSYSGSQLTYNGKDYGDLASIAQAIDNATAEPAAPYTITPSTYTNKAGKTTPMHAVSFTTPPTYEQRKALAAFAREKADGRKARGWCSDKDTYSEWLFRTEEDARKAGEMIADKSGEAVADAQPMTAEELREAVAPTDKPAAPKDKKPKKAPINRVSLEDVAKDLQTKGEAKLSDHAEPLTPADAPKDAQHEISDDEMQSLANELRDLLGIGEDEGDSTLKFRDPGELTPQERQRIQSAGIRLAMGLVERGTTSFPDYATKMVGLLGDKIRPWLKSFYEGARWTPGYENYAFTPSEEVARFDVQNFDKKQADPIAQAAMIVEERKASTASEQAQKELTEIRNNNRKKQDEQTAADTAALAEKAEAVASEAESLAETSEDTAVLNRAGEEIDNTLDEINDQLALLGYYEAEADDAKFHESYGYMLTAEKKAVADATKLAKQLVNDLGLDIKVTSATTPLGRKSVKKGTALRANLAPAGGDVTIALPLQDGRELHIYIGLDPVHSRGGNAYKNGYGYGDNLEVRSIMYRVEAPEVKGADRYGNNQWIQPDCTYSDFLNAVKYEARNYLPKAEEAEPYDAGGYWDRHEITETEKNGFKVGEKVWYTRNDGKHKRELATIVDFGGGSDVTLDTGMAPVMYEACEWSQIEKQEPTTPKDKPAVAPKEDIFEEAARVAKEAQEKKKPKAPAKKKAEVKPEQPIGDLFGGLFDEPISDEKKTDVQPRPGTAERAGGHEPQPNEPLGESQRNEVKRTDRGGMGGRNDHPVSDGKRSTGVSEHPALRAELEPLPEAERKNVRNNHAERGVDYAPKGEDARIKANIEAIELAKRLLDAGETATPEQMAILRKFSGWGGLGKAFNDNGYNPTVKRLRELLGEDGYNDAVMSRNSAYYTPANVIDAMWDVARALGFKGGNVLEGSAGIGNILGLMPSDMSDRSNIHAVEIDRTTGGILSLLYPDARVDVQGFERTKVRNNSIDLAITNVPFVTGLHVKDDTGDKDLSKKFRNIHDFCIAKNVRKLREGGIGIFITSSGTMDNSKELRRWIINEGNADVIGAFRMHNKTFGGTGATSDIIVVRKRVNSKPSANAIDVTEVTAVRVADYDTGDTRKVKGQEVPIIKPFSMTYNKYFAEHPENMAGEMLFNFERGETWQPTSRALFPSADKPQDKMLSEWVSRFADMEEEAPATNVEEAVTRINEKLGDGVKEGSMVLNSEGELCMARMGEAVPLGLNKNKVKGHTKAECFKAYSAIKKALSDVLEYQSTNEEDAGLEPLLKELNRAFDTFTRTYGNLHKNTAISFLRNDVDFSSIMALETYSEKGDKKGNKVVKVGKTDIFSRRVIEKEKEPQPTTVKDGILASLYKSGSIDVDYISEALGMSKEQVKQEIVDSGLGFENPSTGAMEVSYQYLSGNVREKLHIAQENNEDGRYDPNISALEKVMPMTIPAHLIKFSLGSSWIEPKLYEDFVEEKTGIRVKLTNAGGTWFMKTPWSTFNEKNRAMSVTSKMCDKTIMGHELIEAAITNKQITVSKTTKKWDGTSETITDKAATAECSTKIDEIRAEFKDWARERMQADPDMSARIEHTYNEQFNNYVPMSIPDEFVPQHFGGQVTELHGRPFALRPHQGRAVVRGTTEPILLAHEVGTGKTYTLITTAMEMRRLGTARKPMIVVQNATVGQFVESAKEIYPNAKVLTIEEADRTAEGRKNFYAKIKYNDWDMIVVPESVFERIPDSEERELAYIQDVIEEKLKVLDAMREADDSGRSMIVRQAEKELEEQRDRLAELTEAIQGKKKKRDEKREATTRQNAEVRAMEMLDREVDDVENFDDMGIDALLVDEAHEYKHLGFSTAMQRGVKGVDPSYSKKSQGVYLKTQAVMERNHGRNVVFATGTPISNTAAEIWTFMRYLMPADTMKEYGIYYFDDFVRNFGNLAQMVEFKTNGKFAEVSRFARYVNLPELVRIWSGVADTVLTREAGGVSDKIPEMEGGKPTDIYLPQTRALRSVMKYVKAELDRYDKMEGKEKKENSHIPLTMYGIAKAAAVDARLVVDNAEDDPNSKTNATVRETLRSLKESAKYKGTVAIFSDNYQNKRSGFNLYEEIRNKLIAEGVPAEQIVIIKSGMTIKKKLDIFEKVNAGEIRVVLGSTFTLGTGVNIQERLHTLIHVDAPNRPMDYTQRNGRALRQGNLHKDMGIPVRIIRFGVEDSLDVTAYQRLKTKGAIADSIMNGSKMMQNSMENRVLEEEEDSFGDMTAQLSGSEYAILKNQAEREVRNLTAKQKGHDIDQIYIHNQLPKVEGLIKGAERRIEIETKNLEIIGKHWPDGTIKKITIGKLTFDNVEAMEDFFKEQNAKMNEAADKIQEGADNWTSKLTIDVNGLPFEVTTNVTRIVDSNGQGQINFEPKREVTYSCEALGIKDRSVKGNRLKNIMKEIAERIVTGADSQELLARGQQQLARYSDDYSQLKERNGKEFPHKQQLAEAKARLAQYEEAMRKELEEKEKKYAEMDKAVDAASDITLDDDGEDTPTNGDGNKYRLVEEGPVLDFLNNQPLKKGFRYSQWANMGVLPPMTAKQNGEWRAPMIFSRWEQSEEGMMNANGKADLVQGNGRTTGGVAYNPYFHIRTSPLNDQFTAAYDRPELLVVEGYYPESEETSGYHAEGAKDSVGLMDWHSGSVNGQLSEETKVQTMLSRYFKPSRIVPWSEVADLIMERVGDQKVTFPINAVPPMLRAELAKRGAKFSGISGSVAEADIAMLEDLRVRVNAGEWDAGLEKAREYMDAYESSPEAKEARVESLSNDLHTPIRVIRDQSEVDNLPTRRERRAKGWWSSEDDGVVVVLPNNVNVADVDNTVVHEVVGHKGLRALIGEERFDEFLGEVYSHASNPIRKVIDKMTDEMVSAEADRLRVRKSMAHERAGEDVNSHYYTDMAEARVEAEKKREQFRNEATEEYMTDLGGRIGSEGFEKMSRDELTLWGKIKAKVQQFLDKFLQGLKIAKSIRLNDKDLSYILYKSWKNLRKKGVFADAEDAVRRRQSGYDADEVTRFRDPGLGLEETITKMKAEAMQANAGNLQAKRDAMKAIGGNLNHLRQAMARQREYDITTVKSVSDLARVLMEAGLLDDLSQYETKRILGAINNVVGRQDVSQYVQKVMDIMVDNQLRLGANTLGRLLSIRGSRVDARGIEVQGELDPDGQRIAQVVRKSTTLPKDDIDNRIADAINRMSSTDNAIADEATIEYAGLQIARQYVEDITESKAEEKALRDSIKQAKEDKDAGQMTEAAYKQYVEATNDAIRQNKIDRAEAFHSLVEQVGDVLSGSIERAKAWREAEKQRVEEIHHNANSDMEGRPTDEHHKDDRTQKIVNNSFARFLLAPLATFDQMLRMFGKKNSRGEGYLWNRYMRGWVEASEKEYTGYQKALKVLDKKVSEVFGKEMTWGDLFAIDRKLPKASVSFWDGGEMKDHELTQGNLLYIYMADKMSDGRMKLRRMGITEDDVENIKNFLDPRFIQLADWMQEEFLVDKRNEYNEVHKRMFGASMAAIENYFPLKILANARLENVDVADDTTDTALPATSTGSIIKRRRNNLALDVTGANAFSVILDHLQQMERWAAFAEFNRDLNTLLSYKRFRNQVMNMSSAYGAGKTLWNNFRNVCSMAAGAYRPPIAALDKSAVNIAKGVTAAKVSFRIFTALKQFLSIPAYMSDSNPKYLVANIVNPIDAWNWTMKNLPLFEKRWKSRMAGDPRLLKTDMDWKMWRSRVVELASRVGMSPNAFVDALTVAIGAHSMYQTKLAKYKRQGYDPDVAEQRAKQDATILFNQTQQSSEGAFLSTMQVDRSWLSVLFTVFRNSSMSYSRQLYDAIRNISHRFTPGYKGLTEEFMAKQMRRDGIDPDQADRNAKQEYRRGIVRDLVRVGVFGYILQFAWNLGAYLPYLILGENEEEKDKMMDDVFNHTMFGSIEGLTGGDIMSAAGNMWVSGEGNPAYLTKDMPLASDVLSILKNMDKDQVSAMNDVINLCVQSGFGVNPQSLTDAVTAVMDFCGDDAETSRECALLIARVLNCPQSQIDKIYFDELDASARDASKMTPSEIAERYARYKVRRGAPLTGWAYGSEQREKLMEKYRTRSNTLAKERLATATDKAVSPNMAEILGEYEQTKERVSEIKKVKSRDEDRYYDLLDELEATPEYDRYEIIKDYKRDVDALTKEWLKAKTPAERDSCAQAIIALKREMMNDLKQAQ